MRRLDDITIEGHPIRITFDDEHEETYYTPVGHAHAFCFSKEGKLLIAKPPGKSWTIPGGTIEKGETPIQTLHREVDEEASILIEEVSFISAVYAEYKDNWKKNTHLFRYFGIIKEEKELKKDPAINKYWKRKYIDPKEFSKFVSWGKSGVYMVEKCVELYDKWNSKNN